MTTCLDAPPLDLTIEARLFIRSFRNKPFLGRKRDSRMVSTKFRVSARILCVLFALTWSAQATAAPPAVPPPLASRPSDVVFTSGWWSLRPIVSFDGAAKVVGVLAVRADDDAVGENIRAILYTRAGDAWRGECWTDATGAEASAAAKQAFNIPDYFDGSWGQGLEPSRLPGLSAPYMFAFRAADPLSTKLRDTKEREGILLLLKEAGYPVADIPFDVDGSACGGAARWLNALAESAENAEAGRALYSPVHGPVPPQWNAPWLKVASCVTMAWIPPPSTATGFGAWGCGNAGNYEAVATSPTTCQYTRYVICTSCRTITVSPAGQPAYTVEQCFIYQCTQAAPCVVATMPCPPAYNNRACVDNTDTFAPQGPQQQTPWGPTPTVPGHPPIVRPTTMPDCNGGTKPW